ncbi:Cytochrome P450 6a9 [Carabus blaptoides fortunei]
MAARYNKRKDAGRRMRKKLSFASADTEYGPDAAHTVEDMTATDGSSHLIGDSNNGNILGMLEIISHYDPLLDEQLKKVKESKIEKKRLQTNEYEIFERFMEFVDCNKKTREAIVNLILKTLGKRNIPISECRGQGYDNGSNMSEAKGVQAKILEIDPLAIFSPCACHSLNLCGVNAAECCPEAITFSAVIQKLYNIFSGSPQSKALGNIFDNHIKNNEPLDIKDIFARLTTDTIGSCAFGLDCNSLKDPDTEFRRYGKKQTVEYREKNKVHRRDFLDLLIRLKNNESVLDDLLESNAAGSEGMRFAILQVKIVLASILKDYKFTLDSKTVTPMRFDPKSIFLSPVNTVWLQTSKCEI